MVKRVIIAAVLALSVAAGVIVGSCAPMPTAPEPAAGVVSIPGTGGLWVVAGSQVYRFVDKGAGVVCWVYATENGGGISCLPLAETTLDLGR